MLFKFGVCASRSTGGVRIIARPNEPKQHCRDIGELPVSEGAKLFEDREGRPAQWRVERLGDNGRSEKKKENIKASGTDIAEAAERLNTGQKGEGATGSLAIVASVTTPRTPRSLHHGSRLPAMSRGEPQVGVW